MEEQTEIPATESSNESSEASPQASEPERSPLAEFCTQISSFFSEKERFSSFRALSEGLFISEELVVSTAEAFQNWKTTQHQKSEKKETPLKQLFGSETPALKYLLDGKLCLAGYLAPTDLSREKKLPLPRFQGSLLEGQTYLHMRDPILSRVPGLESKVDASGFRLVVTSRKEPAVIRSDIFSTIASVMQRSRSVIKRFPAIENAMRNCLPAFVTLWGEARLIPAEYRLLLPARFRKSKEHSFLQVADFVVVQDSNGHLVDCYGLRGKNLHQFLVRETEELKRAVKGGRVGKFQFSRGNRPRAPLGMVRLERESFQVAAPAFKYFVERVGKRKEVPPQLQNRYTLRDCFEQFCDLMSVSDWVNMLDIPPEHRRKEKRWNYRRRKSWIFTLDGTEAVETLVDLEDKSLRKPREARSKTTLAGDKPPHRRERSKRPSRQKRAQSGLTQESADTNDRGSASSKNE